MRLIVFAATVLVSAVLLMMVQPMAARMLLPQLGGSPNVWNACVAFFQMGLLAGYAYAMLAPRWLGVGGQAIAHVVLVAAAIATLPFELTVVPGGHPAAAVFVTLVRGVGLAYVMLSATSTLIQQWYARVSGDDPYFLYAASNAGSFLGLFLYPFLIDTVWPLSQQAVRWRDGFAVFAGMMGLVVVVLLRSPARTASLTASPAPHGTLVGRWVLLAMAPSSLMLSVTYQITTDVAPVPLLWILPLAAYLLTFAVAFSRRPLVPQAKVAYYLPVVILILALLWFSEANRPVVVVLIVQLAGFAWLALFCHGELSRLRPKPDRLAAFFFWVALGGVLGGVFSAFVAPVVFPALTEYPLMIVLVAALGPKGGAVALDYSKAILVGFAMLFLTWIGLGIGFALGPLFLALAIVPLLATLFLPKALPHALALFLIFATGMFWPSSEGDVRERRRGFFGIHRVTEGDRFVTLLHGSTVHGQQSMLDPYQPLAYYHRESPIADVFNRLSKADGYRGIGIVGFGAGPLAPFSVAMDTLNTPRLERVGVVGLGAGALVSYGKEGQRWTFFEIDPDVVDIARSHFTHLRNSLPLTRVEVGDARVSLEKSTETFDLLIIDAFGSDAIPTHLLTQEAMRIYASRLKPGGVLAFHISNNFVDLFPVLGAMPGWHGWGSVPGMWHADKDAGKLPSWWAVLVQGPSDFTLPPRRWQPLPAGGPLWTDDFANVPAVVRWGEIFSGGSP